MNNLTEDGKTEEEEVNAQMTALLYVLVALLVVAVIAWRLHWLERWLSPSPPAVSSVTTSTPAAPGNSPLVPHGTTPAATGAGAGAASAAP